jgi:hypothetical protein
MPAPVRVSTPGPCNPAFTQAVRRCASCRARWTGQRPGAATLKRSAAPVVCLRWRVPRHCTALTARLKEKSKANPNPSTGKKPLAFARARKPECASREICELKGNPSSYTAHKPLLRLGKMPCSTMEVRRGQSFIPMLMGTQYRWLIRRDYSPCTDVGAGLTGAVALLGRIFRLILSRRKMHWTLATRNMITVMQQPKAQTHQIRALLISRHRPSQP